MTKRAAVGRALHLSWAGVERLPLRGPGLRPVLTPSGAAPSFDACPSQMERKQHLAWASIDKGVLGGRSSSVSCTVQARTVLDRLRSPAEILPSS